MDARDRHEGLVRIGYGVEGFRLQIRRSDIVSLGKRHHHRRFDDALAKRGYFVLQEKFDRLDGVPVLVSRRLFLLDGLEPGVNVREGPGSEFCIAGEVLLGRHWHSTAWLSAKPLPSVLR